MEAPWWRLHHGGSIMEANKQRQQKTETRKSNVYFFKAAAGRAGGNDWRGSNFLCENDEEVTVTCSGMVCYIELQHKPTFLSSGLRSNSSITGFRVSAYGGSFAKTKAKLNIFRRCQIDSIEIQFQNDMSKGSWKLFEATGMSMNIRIFEYSNILGLEYIFIFGFITI